MDFKIYLILILLLSYSDGIGQVSLVIEKIEKTNNSIHLKLKMKNESENVVILKRVKKWYDTIDYFNLEEADSINYEGISFLLFQGKDTLDIYTFPINMKHQSRFVNWFHFYYLKVKRTFTNNNLVVEGRSAKTKKVKVKLDGFSLKEDRDYILQMIYYLPNTKKVVTSNEIHF